MLTQLESETEKIFIAIKKDFEQHPAWIGKVSGLDAEKMVRNQPAYTYVLRAGEFECQEKIDYYITFSLPDGFVKHQPLVIFATSDGWCFENWDPGGPYGNDVSINDIIHLPMHCAPGEASWLEF